MGQISVFCDKFVTFGYSKNIPTRIVIVLCYSRNYWMFLGDILPRTLRRTSTY